ncbi:MAG TPA: hypothetical protein VG893_04235 [Terracidiphilus sp.]|nr:hypothetical protein [Terracidiphilus sp.]
MIHRKSFFIVFLFALFSVSVRGQEIAQVTPPEANSSATPECNSNLPRNKKAENPSISSTAPSQADLCITIKDLPAATDGRVTIIAPDGKRSLLNRTRLIRGVPGAYTISVDPVPVGHESYYAIEPHREIVASPGTTTQVTIDYFDIIPDTTKVLDEDGRMKLNVRREPNDVFHVTTVGKIAQSLKLGDILVSQCTPRLQDGLFIRVTKISKDGPMVIAEGNLANLETAIIRGRLIYDSDDHASIPCEKEAVAGFRSAIWKVSLPRMEETALSLTSEPPSPPCPAGSHTIHFPIAYTIDTSSDVKADESAINDKVGTHLSGNLTLCPRMLMDVSWGDFSLNSARVKATIPEQGQLTISAANSVSLQAHKELKSFTPTEPFVVFVGDVPIVLQAQITPVVWASLRSETSFAVGLEEEAQLTEGFEYNDGTLHRLHTWIAPSFRGKSTYAQNVTGKLSIGAKIGALVYGTLFPYVTPSVFVLEEYGPSEKVSAGLAGSAGLDIKILGMHHGVETPEWDFFKRPIWPRQGNSTP